MIRVFIPRLKAISLRRIEWYRSIIVNKF